MTTIVYNIVKLGNISFKSVENMLNIFTKIPLVKPLLNPFH